MLLPFVRLLTSSANRFAVWTVAGGLYTRLYQHSYLLFTSVSCRAAKILYTCHGLFWLLMFTYAKFLPHWQMLYFLFWTLKECKRIIRHRLSISRLDFHILSIMHMGFPSDYLAHLVKFGRFGSTCKTCSITAEGFSTTTYKTEYTYHVKIFSVN